MKTTLLYKMFVFYWQLNMVFGQTWVKILIVPLFWLKFNHCNVVVFVKKINDNTVKLTLILSYSIPKFVRIESYFQLLLNGGRLVATLRHSPFA